MSLHEHILESLKSDTLSVDDFPEASKNNADKAEIYGCYFCLRSFHKSAITDTCDNGKTLRCPNCSIDSLLPDMINKDKLKAGLEKWFTGK